MILDREPNPEGNVVLFPTEPLPADMRVLVFKDAATAEAAFPGKDRYLDHHVHCPQASEWRQGKLI